MPNTGSTLKKVATVALINSNSITTVPGSSLGQLLAARRVLFDQARRWPPLFEEPGSVVADVATLDNDDVADLGRGDTGATGNVRVEGRILGFISREISILVPKPILSMDEYYFLHEENPAVHGVEESVALVRTRERGAFSGRV